MKDIKLIKEELIGYIAEQQAEDTTRARRVECGLMIMKLKHELLKYAPSLKDLPPQQLYELLVRENH